MGAHYTVLHAVISLLILQQCYCYFNLGNGCPHATYRFRDLCYISSLVAARYDEAEILCRAGNGNLAIITDDETLLFVQQLRVRQALFDYYVGITDKDGEGNWTYSNDNSSTVKYFKWYPGEPNNFGHGEDCATFRMRHSLDWNDVGCKMKTLYICQYEGEMCKNSEINYGKICYELSKSFKNFDDANADCKNKGGIVASPRNDAEQLFIQKIINEDRYWKSLTREKINNILLDPSFPSFPNAWIGVKYNTELENWSFADGQSLTYHSWEFAYPVISPDNSLTCVSLDKNWIVSGCQNRYGFVCQYPVQDSLEDTSNHIPSTVDDGGNFTENTPLSENLHY